LCLCGKHPNASDWVGSTSAFSFCRISSLSAPVRVVVTSAAVIQAEATDPSSSTSKPPRCVYGETLRSSDRRTSALFVPTTSWQRASCLSACPLLSGSSRLRDCFGLALTLALANFATHYYAKLGPEVDPYFVLTHRVTTPSTTSACSVV